MPPVRCREGREMNESPPVGDVGHRLRVPTARCEKILSDPGQSKRLEIAARGRAQILLERALQRPNADTDVLGDDVAERHRLGEVLFVVLHRAGECAAGELPNLVDGLRAALGTAEVPARRPEGAAL